MPHPAGIRGTRQRAALRTLQVWGGHPGTTRIGRTAAPDYAAAPPPPVGIRSGNAAMTAMAGMGHPATPSLAPTFRATIAIMAGCATLALALLAVANVPGPELPGFNGFFASGVFVAELATAYLLLVHFTGTSSWSVLLLAAAYLFSALMAVPYLLIFPGAVRAGEPLLGTPQSIAYIFASWTLG